MTSRSERVAVLAAALAWLVLLVYPLAYVANRLPPAAEAAPALVALAALVVAHVRAAVSIARAGAPRLRPVELTVVAAVAVALPLVFNEAAWFGGTVFLAALVALSWPAGRALLGVAATTALAVATAVLTDSPAPQAISVPLITALAGVIVVVVVRQAILARELARVTAEAERLRLARELHDSVKQHAFVAAMELGAARARLRGGDGGDGAVAEHVDQAAEAVTRVQRELSGVIDELRPVGGELAPALRRLVTAWTARTGTVATVDVETDRALPAEPLLPVASEALANVERHAGASRVTLVVRDGELTVTDDGSGFDPVVQGHGLRGMRERLAERGGTLEVSSGPSGTTLRARCPT